MEKEAGVEMRERHLWSVKSGYGVAAMAIVVRRGTANIGDLKTKLHAMLAEKFQVKWAVIQHEYAS